MNITIPNGGVQILSFPNVCELACFINANKNLEYCLFNDSNNDADPMEFERGDMVGLCIAIGLTGECDNIGVTLQTDSPTNEYALIHMFGKR